jgi:cytoskeletal protein RodZ
MSWLQDKFKSARELFTEHWVAILAIVVVLGLVVTAKVVSSSSTTTQATPTTTQPNQHASSTTTQAPSGSTTSSSPHPTTTKPDTNTQTYIPLSKLTLNQRGAAIVISGAFTELPGAPPATVNKLLTTLVTHLPRSVNAKLIYGVGQYPAHPTVVKLMVGKSPLCIQVPQNRQPGAPHVLTCP